ncbi:MAG: hypothetical protein Fur0037_01300 [Planctomycetota bacterium]
MNWFRTKQRGNEPPWPENRHRLFACAPLVEVGGAIPDDPDTPQSRFHAALAHLQVGDSEHAIAQIQEILRMDEANSLLSLQAWSCLRELGREPVPPEAGVLRGVVVDLGRQGSVETAAAYEDGSAEVLHPGGCGSTPGHRDASVDKCVEALLAAASEVQGEMADGMAAVTPTDGRARISFLTFAGIRALDGEEAALRRDPGPRAVLELAERLCSMLAGRDSPAHTA